LSKGKEYKVKTNGKTLILSIFLITCITFLTYSGSVDSSIFVFVVSFVGGFYYGEGRVLYRSINKEIKEELGS